MAVRTELFDSAVRRFIARHPRGTIVTLGAGLDARFARCVEAATKERLRFSVPVPGRPTLARTEMIIGTPGTPATP